MSGRLVSIVTPTKNRLALLRETADSVAVQTYAAWEHLIVDDGSDDGTQAEFEARAADDPRVRLIRRQGDRSGANVCRNLGLSAARGDYVVFLDSDDLLTADCLAGRVGVMERNADVDFATFCAGVFTRAVGDIEGRGLDAALGGDDLLRFLYFEPPWIITGPIWRRSSLEKLGGFDESLPSWQDIDLHIRALTAGMKYLRLCTVDHHVRWQWEDTKVSIEQRRSATHLQAAHRILEKFEAEVRAGPGMTWTRQRALCSLYFFVAENWLRSGDQAAALRAWRRVRERGLGTPLLHASGALLLRLQGLGPSRAVGERVAHKWKGWMRLRSEPELVAR